MFSSGLTQKEDCCLRLRFEYVVIGVYAELRLKRTERTIILESLPHGFFPINLFTKTDLFAIQNHAAISQRPIKQPDIIRSGLQAPFLRARSILRRTIESRLITSTICAKYNIFGRFFPNSYCSLIAVGSLNSNSSTLSTVIVLRL